MLLAPMNPQFTMRLVVIIPATRRCFVEFNPLCLFLPLDMTVAKDYVCSVFVACARRIYGEGCEPSKADLAIRTPIAVTVSNRNHVRRVYYSDHRQCHRWLIPQPEPSYRRNTHAIVAVAKWDFPIHIIGKSKAMCGLVRWPGKISSGGWAFEDRRAPETRVKS